MRSTPTIGYHDGREGAGMSQGPDLSNLFHRLKTDNIIPCSLFSYSIAIAIAPESMPLGSKRHLSQLPDK